MKGLIKIKKETIVRAMIESSVNLVLKRVQSDPERSIRNTIELAMNNSRGRFQRSLFEAAQRMLKNEDSAYYTLAKRAVSEIDHDIIKKFGINLGYNGCTLGAEHIRCNEEKLGFNIPWALYIDAGDSEINSPEASCNTPSVISDVISQGTKLGVYVYFIFGDMSISQELQKIYQKFGDCAFIALCNAECINENSVKRFNQIDNLMIAVDSDDTNKLKSACAVMKKYKRLYSIYKYYNGNSAEDLFTDDRLKFYEDTGAAFVCMIPSDNCGDETRTAVRKKILDIRFGQHYPYFAIDFAGDMVEIDHVISDDTCWVSFDSDGTVHSSTGKYSGDEYSILSHPLSDILSRVTPPKV